MNHEIFFLMFALTFIEGILFAFYYKKYYKNLYEKEFIKNTNDAFIDRMIKSFSPDDKITVSFFIDEEPYPKNIHSDIYPFIPRLEEHIVIDHDVYEVLEVSYNIDEHNLVQILLIKTDISPIHEEIEEE